jgi:hypothetical protein
MLRFEGFIVALKNGSRTFVDIFSCAGVPAAANGLFRCRISGLTAMSARFLSRIPGAFGRVFGRAHFWLAIAD